MSKKRRTPQYKKAKSYQKDCRNVYGESTQGSRKSIPLNKDLSRRRTRRVAKQLTRLDGDDVPEIVEGNVKKLQREAWQKMPDAPLGEFIEMQREKRKKLVGRHKRVKERWAKALELANGDEEKAFELLTFISRESDV